jgi:hypothetical protein
MGGFGSGCWPTKLSVDDCRQLDIGLLCDGGALDAFPRGQILWRSERQPERLALLDYWLVRECWPRRPGRLLLCYVYWPAAAARPQDDEVELCVRRGIRPSALCPACGRAARKLYARRRRSISPVGSARASSIRPRPRCAYCRRWR